MQDIFVWGDTPRGPEIAECLFELMWNMEQKTRIHHLTVRPLHDQTWNLQMRRGQRWINSRSYSSWLCHCASGNRSWTESKCWINLEEISWCLNIVVVSRFQDKLWLFEHIRYVCLLTEMFSGARFVKSLNIHNNSTKSNIYLVKDPTYLLYSNIFGRF